LRLLKTFCLVSSTIFVSPLICEPLLRFLHFVPQHSLAVNLRLLFRHLAQRPSNANHFWLRRGNWDYIRCLGRDFGTRLEPSERVLASALSSFHL
jgi:hypothetical protein